MSLHWSRLISLAALLALLIACKGEQPAAIQTPAAQPAPVVATAEPDPSQAPVSAPTQAAFDPASVPLSTATLPPFPFFKTPDGLKSGYADADKDLGFDRHYFIAGKNLMPIEGKVFRDMFNLDGADGARKYSVLEFHKNYENAITALGGKKVSEAQFSDELLNSVGGRDTVEKHFKAMAPVPDHEHHSYLLRSANKEYWIQISTGAIPLHGNVVVLEREGMKQSLGFIDASAMKKAIDETGKVALQINFDLDKATLRPDAIPTIDEIVKLLEQDAALKLSIDGHTDSTGSADHNRDLSKRRAQTVMGTLVGKGIMMDRLQAQGFGPDKPVADNNTDEGRAKNRRVELVKR